jgi:phosphoadenosine phosphosulfate reductase
LNPLGKTWTPAELSAVSARLEAEPPQAALEWGLRTFGRHLAVACSFGAEDVALVDMAVKIDPEVRVFYLDTDVLFPETYDTIGRVAARYGIRPERIRPALTLAEQAAAYGDSLWATNPDQCCAMRKVEPLQRTLATLGAWVTGVRRDQAPTRADTPVVQWDARFGLVKINPLVRWTWADVWTYIHTHDVPYNELHDQNYPSIGCTHCTRPVHPGEDPRAGRWAGFNKTECGLHPGAAK